MRLPIKGQNGWMVSLSFSKKHANYIDKQWHLCNQFQLPIIKRRVLYIYYYFKYLWRCHLDRIDFQKSFITKHIETPNPETALTHWSQIFGSEYFNCFCLSHTIPLGNWDITLFMEVADWPYWSNDVSREYIPIFCKQGKIAIFSWVIFLSKMTSNAKFEECICLGSPCRS